MWLCCWVELEVGDRPRDGVGVFVYVEALVDGMGDRLDLGPQISLNIVEVETVFPVDQVNSKTQVAVSTGTADAVEVRLGVLGEVEVDNDVDCLDVDTTSEEVGTDKVAADAVPEVVEDAVPGLLGHPGVTVEAGVAELGDLLCEELYTVGRVAEDDGLVDLKLGEQGVQAVDFLLFLHEGVILGNAPQGELVHEVDLVGADHVLVGEILDGKGERG